MSELRVLLVDDSAEESSVIREQAPEAIKIVWTREATEACRRLAEERFDLILLDLTLPDEWGLDGFVRVSTIAPDTPVLALAMPGDEDLARHAVSAGAAGFAMKPEITTEAIGSLVRSTLADHESSVPNGMQLRDLESGFYTREAFLHLAEKRQRLATATGKALLLFTTRVQTANDLTRDDQLASAAAVLHMTFRSSDLVGCIGDRAFAALGLVHPSDESDVILAERLDEVLHARNSTVNRRDPIALEWHLERLDPEIPFEELRGKMDRWG